MYFSSFFKKLVHLIIHQTNSCHPPVITLFFSQIFSLWVNSAHSRNKKNFFLKKAAWRKMNLNVSWWWMVELIFWQELKLCNDTWHTFDERESKTKRKKEKRKWLLFTVCVITVWHMYNGPYSPFWQHTSELSFVFMSLPLGVHENNTITTLKPGQTVCCTFVHFHLLTWADLF